MKSEFGKINKTDLLNALYYFVGVLVLNSTALLGIGVLPTLAQWMQVIGAAVSAGMLNIFKNISTNSDGKYFKKEN